MARQSTNQLQLPAGGSEPGQLRPPFSTIPTSILQHSRPPFSTIPTSILAIPTTILCHSELHSDLHSPTLRQDHVEFNNEIASPRPARAQTSFSSRLVALNPANSNLHSRPFRAPLSDMAPDGGGNWPQNGFH